MTASSWSALKEGHAPTADYVRKLRQVLPAAFPEDMFYFQAADMVTQILNFGLPAQIDVRTVGYDRANNLAVAKELRRRIAAIPGIADAHLQQEVDAPAFYAEIDRARAAQLGLNASTHRDQPQCQPELVGAGVAEFLDRSDVGHSLLSGGADAGAPTSIRSTTSATRRSRPRWPPRPTPIPGMLGNVATFKRDIVPTNTNQANIQPVYDVYASVQGRDLGSVAGDISKIVAELQKKLKPGNTIQVLGQIQSMNDSFRNLGIGLLFAAVFVYLLMVVNYQNFGDPFVVILALPATFCGIVTMLFITGTTLNVPSLMGAIMAVGVASANSILLVTFAREQQLPGTRPSMPRIERRPHPHPAGADDSGRDDRRHDPDGDRRRRRGAERRAGARRHRRPAVRDADHAADRALSVRHAAQGQRRQACTMAYFRGTME